MTIINTLRSYYEAVRFKRQGTTLTLRTPKSTHSINFGLASVAVLLFSISVLLLVVLLILLLVAIVVVIWKGMESVSPGTTLTVLL